MLLDSFIAKISPLLRANNYTESEIQRATKAASRPMMGRKQLWKKQDQIILKLAFINDALSSRITQRVRQFSPDMCVVFKSGPSLKQKLVRSSLFARVRPRDVQAARKWPGHRRPMMGRSCDAGMRNGEFLSKNVVYSSKLENSTASFLASTHARPSIAKIQ